MSQNNIVYTRFVNELLETKRVVEVEALTKMNKRYLYEIKKGQFDNIKKEHLDKLDAVMQTKNDAEIDINWKISATTNLSISLTTFLKAQDGRLCLALTGTTGFGKTAACKRYRHKTADVIYVHANTEMTKVGFLDAIAADLSIPHYQRGYSVEVRLKTIVRFMLKLQKPLLIIDDAGKLRDSAFRMFQILFDEAAGRIGFVLTGVPEFRQKVFKCADKGIFCYKEIARRIGWVELDSIYQKDVLSICHENGINDESAISYLCDNIGDFDTLKRTICTAKAVAAKRGINITRSLLAELNKDITNYRVSRVVKE